LTRVPTPRSLDTLSAPIGLPRWCALLVAALLAAGGPISPPDVPTATPPPASATPPPTQPPTASPTYAPLTAATQPVVLEPPVAEPTATPGKPSINLPDAPITILEPAQGSQVTSPIRVIGYAQPTYQERISVRLIDQAGDAQDEQTAILMAYPGGAGRFVSHLSFDLAGVSDRAFLQIDSYDRRYGRLAQRTTQPLVLLSAGSDRVLPGHQGPAQLAIVEPRPGAILPPGPVHIRGGGWTIRDGEVLVQAIDRQGQVVASSPVTLDVGQDGRIGTFELDLTPAISFWQYGRLAVSELDPASGEVVFLYSIEVAFRH
jgi:hypothetical protein